MSILSRFRGRRFLWWLAAVTLVAGACVAYSSISSYLAWREALRTAGFVDELPVPGRGDRVLVVAPHPDDEALGCAGLIRRAVAEGADVQVALMTNGDASELALIFGEQELRLTSANYVHLGERRQQESLAALAALGVPADHVHFLSFPNNGLVPLWLPEHWLYTSPYRAPTTGANHSPYALSFTPQAPYCGQQVLADLMAIMHEVRPTAIFVTHPQDVHPDHWATAAFVRYALETLRVRGAEWAAETRVYGYLIHWPHFPTPRHYAPHLQIIPPPRVREAGAISCMSLPLDPDEVRGKAVAIRNYHSQQPNFDRLLLSFARTNEAFELLGMPSLPPSHRLAWRSADGHRKGLAGAEILWATMALFGDGTVQSEIACSPAPLARQAYLALDLRMWDQRGRPVIITVVIPGSGAPAATCIDPLGQRDVPVDVERPQAGLWRISGLRLPPGSQALEHLFITCWGAVNGRLTDPVPPA